MIPTDWELLKLQDTSLAIIDGDRGNNYPKSDEFSDDGYCLFLSAQNITKNGFRLNKKQFISEEKDNMLRKGKLKDLDIIITTRGSVGHIAYNENIQYKDMRINSGMVILRNNDENINQKYIYKLFASSVIQRQIEKIAFGSAQPQLTVKEINKLKIPLPPLKEQEKIADILSTADDKIDVIASQIEKAETLKKGLLQKLLSEGIGHSEFKDSELGKIPKSWEIVKLKDIGQSIIGLTYSPKDVVDYYSEAHLVLRSSNVQNSNILLENNVYVNRDIPEKLIVKQGDILICSRNGSKNLIGKNAYISKEYEGHTFGAFMTIYRSKYSKFVYQLLKTELYQRQINSNMGATINQITTGNLNSFKFPFPPLDEQKQIADILSSADEKLKVLKTKKEKYETLKKGLLQKLLSGEVRV